MGVEAFRQYLKEHGLKLTRERETIAGEALAMKGHFDMDELYVGLLNRGIKVSKASVYRTLPLLLDSGIIEEVERTDKHAHYERTHGQAHHDHMLCVSCGKVLEFYSDELEKLQERLCRERSFTGASHTLEIRGYCKKCSTMKKG